MNSIVFICPMYIFRKLICTTGALRREGNLKRCDYFNQLLHYSVQQQQQKGIFMVAIIKNKRDRKVQRTKQNNAHRISHIFTLEICSTKQGCRLFSFLSVDYIITGVRHLCNVE